MSIFPAGILIVIIVSFLCCCMGFKRFVWFMSVGYGLSSAGIGATLFIMSLVRGDWSIIYLIQCLVFVVYGFRLGGFLLIREMKNEAYRKKLAEVGGEAKVPIFVAAFMWVYCGLVYVMQSASPVYRLLNASGAASNPNVWAYVGTVISIIGVCIEALADKQKSDSKKLHPDMPAMDGLYKMCRCPNYFGEMLFWTGGIITGIGALQGAGQIIIALIGYCEIIFVMMSGAKRVEGRHIKNYGDKEEYQKYADSVPLIIPLIPLYHMTSPEKMAEEAKKKEEKAAAKAAKKG